MIENEPVPPRQLNPAVRNAELAARNASLAAEIKAANDELKKSYGNLMAQTDEMRRRLLNSDTDAESE